MANKMTIVVFLLMLSFIFLAVSSVTPNIIIQANEEKPQAKVKSDDDGITVEKYFLLTATAYYPGPECTYPHNDGVTAYGVEAGKGVIAIDHRRGPLKMFQKVYVEGYGHGLCCDVGSAIKGWKIDLCFDTLDEAKEWGVKLVKVYVLD